MNFLILLKNIFIVIFSKKVDFVFYSENSFYQNYYQIIIFSLLNENKSILYLSSDINDKIQSNKIKNLYIGTGYSRYFIFLIVKAKTMILTLTDINNHELKTNRNVDKYIYLFHAINSTHRAFTKSAFNNYDAILCVGDYQKKELRELEIYNKSHKKKLYDAGYIYFDFLKKNSNNSISENYILIAPSWNYSKKSFFNLQSKNLINYLLKLKYKVILRPHPEHHKREIDLIRYFENLSKLESNFVMDSSRNNITSMNKSDVLITDCSGIAPEFLFTYKRPIIYFDRHTKIHNQEFDQIKLPIFEDIIKKKFGFIPLEQENFTQDFILEAKNKFKDKNLLLDEFATENFFNFQDSGKTHSKILIEQLTTF